MKSEHWFFFVVESLLRVFFVFVKRNIVGYWRINASKYCVWFSFRRTKLAFKLKKENFLNDGSLGREAMYWKATLKDDEADKEQG